jgi:glycosyltransferase involved in cell wall biosynthesis
MNEKCPKFIVLTDLPDRQNVWWEKYVRLFVDNRKIFVEIESVPDAGIALFSLKTFTLLLIITAKYLRRYRHYDFIITFQANVSTAWIGILKRVCKSSHQRHVALQFHRREEDNSLKSKIIYLILRSALKSTDKIICSSKEEISYYKRVLSLPEDKFVFIPLCVDPKILEIKNENGKNGNYIISAGKTLRDYRTLVKAVENQEIKLIIISDKKSVEDIKIPINVKVLTDVPYWKYIQMMARSMFVVIPLEDRLISTGQSVALAAMALGKTIIITKTSGTKDYVIDNVNGIFVEPCNDEMLREKIENLFGDREKIRNLGTNAREFIKENLIITRYLERLRSELGILSSG